MRRFVEVWPFGKLTTLFIGSFGLLAAAFLLGEQTARIGPITFSRISPWYLALGCVVLFLIDRSDRVVGARALLVGAVLIAAAYWPLSRWRTDIIRAEPVSAKVYRPSRRSSPPEQVVRMSSLQLESRKYLNRLVGRRRDVALDISAFLMVPRTGSYRFAVASDDRLLLQIDDQTLSRQRVGFAEVALEKGTHRIRLRYRQIGGPAFLSLRWRRPAAVELLGLEHYLSDRSSVTPASVRRDERRAAYSLLVLTLWWTAAAGWLVHIGRSSRAWRKDLFQSLVSMRTARPVRRAAWIVVQLAQIVLLVVAVEFIASFFTTVPTDWQIDHFRLNHTWKPNGRRVLRIRNNPEYEPFLQVFNAQGWLETYDVSRKKPEDVYRIFYVGDSFVEGSVPMDQSVPSLVEKRLNAQFGDRGTKFEVINTGTASYSPTIYYILIRYVISEYSPDLVVVNVDMTDDVDDWVYRKTLVLDDDGHPWAAPPRSLYDQVYFNTAYGAVQATWLTRLTLFLYRHSYAYNFLHDRLPPSRARQERLARAVEQQQEELRAQGVYRRWSWCQHEWDEQTEENAKLTIGTVKKIADYCRDRGIKLLLTGVPHYWQFSSDGRARPAWSIRPHLELEKAARESGAAYFDSHAHLRSAIEGTPQHEYYYRQNMHFNPRGFERWAEAHIEALTDPANELLPASVFE